MPTLSRLVLSIGFIFILSVTCVAYAESIKFPVQKDGYAYTVTVWTSLAPYSVEYNKNTDGLTLKFDNLPQSSIDIDAPKILFNSATTDFIATINGVNMPMGGYMGDYGKNGIRKIIEIPAVIVASSPYIVEFYPKPIPRATVRPSDPAAEKPVASSEESAKTQDGGIDWMLFIALTLPPIGVAVAVAIYANTKRKVRLRQEMRGSMRLPLREPQNQSVAPDSSLGDKIREFEARNKDEL